MSSIGSLVLIPSTFPGLGAAQHVGSLSAYALPAPAIVYVMRGQDAATTAQDVWTSTGSADLSGAGYPSSISRTVPLTKPLRNIVIQSLPGGGV